MQTLKYTFIFILLFPFSLFSQTIWTGNGDGTSFVDNANWDNNMPSLGSTIIFDLGGEIHITGIPASFTQTSSLSEIIINSNTNVTFDNGTNPAIDVYTDSLEIENGSSLALRGNNTFNLHLQKGEISGIIDAGDIHIFSTFGMSSQKIYFEEESELITANPDGFEGSISGPYNFSVSSSFTIRYNGTTYQSTGLLNVGVPLGNIIIENPGNVYSDANIQTETLELIEGNFEIGSFTLTVSENILYQNGLLAGSGASSLNIINGTGSGDDFIIEFDPNNNLINTLTVNRPGSIIEIESELTIENQLNIIGGLLKVMTVLNITSSSPVNASQTDYIITENDAYVKKNTASGINDTIPVGTENSYAPVTINPSAADIYTVSVHDGIFSEGSYGSPLNRNVDLCWEITSTSSTSFNLTLAWNPASQISGFDFANSYISNYNGTEWDNAGVSAGSTNAGLNTQSRSAVNSGGFFGVFSGTNNLPSASDNEIYISENQVYTFTPEEFNYSDADGDDFAKIRILQQPVDGNLFLDYDGDNVINGSDLILTAGNQVLTEEIINGYLKYEPVVDAVDISEYFTFAVSDGLNYSQTPDYVMTINITDNQAPEASDQTFRIPEHSPNGSVVGKIEASDPDGDNIYFYPQENTVYSDAFKLADDGTITVNNSNLLEYSINPSFEYNLDICDDGSPVLCTPIRVTINLEEVITDLVAANYISPNGDGHNDHWLVKGLENGTYEAFIFNAAGKLLFHSPDYRNGWDGTSNGKELPPGVYYYLLKSPDIELKGTVTLVR